MILPTLIGLLVLGALVCAIIGLTGKSPYTAVAAFLLAVIEGLRILPK
jgi:hypothetical protein